MATHGAVPEASTRCVRGPRGLADCWSEASTGKKKKKEEASHSFSEFQLAVTIKQPCEGTRLCDFLADRTFVMKKPLPPANSVFSSELFPVPTCFVLTETVCKYLRIWLKKKNKRKTQRDILMNFEFCPIIA